MAKKLIVFPVPLERWMLFRDGKPYHEEPDQNTTVVWTSSELLFKGKDEALDYIRGGICGGCDDSSSEPMHLECGKPPCKWVAEEVTVYRKPHHRRVPNRD